MTLNEMSAGTESFKMFVSFRFLMNFVADEDKNDKFSRKMQFIEN